MEGNKWKQPRWGITYLFIDGNYSIISLPCRSSTSWGQCLKVPAAKRFLSQANKTSSALAHSFGDLWAALLRNRNTSCHKFISNTIIIHVFISSLADKCSEMCIHLSLATWVQGNPPLQKYANMLISCPLPPTQFHLLTNWKCRYNGNHWRVQKTWRAHWSLVDLKRNQTQARCTWPASRRYCSQD